MKYIIAFVFIVALMLGGGFVYVYSQIRFDAYTIIDYKPKLTTQIFDRHGRLVANLFDGEHRLYAPYEEIPARMIEALVAIEDTSFFEHDGINIEAIFRALIKDVKAMRLVEGASTLTQQLIKNVALSREKTFRRKINEIVLSFKVESELSKEEILERYLNHVYFGHGYYGVKTAAQGYFNKNLNELTIKEIAMLAGLPKAPSSYDPTRNIEKAIARSHQVLSRMRTLGWISEEEYIRALNESPIIYDETLTQNKAPYVVDEVIRQMSAHLDDLRTGGYTLQLSIDLALQRAGFEAIRGGVDTILSRNKEADPEVLNGALIAMHVQTGEVLAMVGGVDYEKSKFNRVVQSKRQPGSSFKPFIYQQALDAGYSPQSKIPDISRVYENEDEDLEDWKPKNYADTFDGLVSLKTALKYSRNLATINLLSALGLDTVHRNLTNLGFQNLPFDLTISLGSFGISPWEYAKFYSAFPNGGVMVEPLLIKSITDRFGYEQKFETTKKQFTSPEQSFLMVDMLKAAVEEGTGKRARVSGIEIGGKTGTTNKNVDAWFCGFSPEVEVLVWFGNDNNTPMGRSETGGGAGAGPFASFMKAFIQEYPQTTRQFQMPPNVERTRIGNEDVFYTPTSPLPNLSGEQNSGASDGGLIF
jgi:penicillin-binding protein 1A